MFRDNDRPDPLDATVRVIIELSRRDISDLDRELFARRQDHGARRGHSRDALIRQLVRDGLQTLAERRLAR